MAVEVSPARVRSRAAKALERRFEAAIFDWDGTAVPHRQASASRVKRLAEALSTAGFDLFVVSGTHVRNVDGQLRARPEGPGRLFLCLNRGSEIFAVGPSGPRLVERRSASPDEDAALTAAAELVQARLAERGLVARIVGPRLNRRKIDLLPVPEWDDPPKARIGELLTAVEDRLRNAGVDSLAGVVALAEAAAAEAGLPDARVTSDAKHVEIGLTDKSDSARWAYDHLWRHGVGPGLVLVAGDEFGPLGGVPGSDSLLVRPEHERVTAVSVGVEPSGVPAGVVHLGGGPDAFVGILEDQLLRRARGDVPELDADPAWTLEVEGLDPELERVHESLLALADGRLGTRGSPLASDPTATPGVFAAGVYTGEGPDETLLPCPLWTRIETGLRPDGLYRALDLHTGVLQEEVRGGALRSARFSSLARPGTAVLRAECPSEAVLPAPPLRPPAGARAAQGDCTGGHWLAVGGDRGVTAAAAEASFDRESSRRLDRVAVYRAGVADGLGSARNGLAEARAAGFETLLHEHRRAWAQRWEDADVVVEGDPDLQRAVRFALFHLMASVADSDEAALGARGLSGPAYRGHVFWDTDVFVLPFLAATHPASARALLEYRVRRLRAARRAARRQGFEGARFPWESARTGFDVTPTHAHLATGEIVPIRNGAHEEHVVAAVAWAASSYLDWTGDEEFERGAGRELLVETARYWCSRARNDNGDRRHIYGVIGPDEYHEPVDDNAYTNVMARWNLRRAAEAVAAQPGDDVTDDERRRWLALADALVDGYDPATGLYEQFAGFFQLEPLVVAEIATRPLAADTLLGRERVGGSQVIKQADVLMLHHLVPDEVEAGSLAPNVAFYEPRTAHGSSLSPGVHAALLAQLGRLDEALGLLRLTARIDLDDLTRTTAGGLHLAAMGSLWQALAFGFAGLRPRGSELAIAPRLPDTWKALELRLRFRGSAVRARFEPGTVVVSADPPVVVRLSAAVPLLVTSDGVRLIDREGSWEVV